MRKKCTVLSTGWLTLICCIFACQSQGPLSLFSNSKEAGVGYNVFVDKDYAYVTNNEGVAIFDVHQPKRLRKVGNIPTGVTFGVYVKHDLAYITGEHGLVIADVSDPSDPEWLGEHIIEEETHRVLVEGSYAYVASDGGLEILDVSDPGKIFPVSHFGSGGAWGIDVCDGIAYLASYTNGLEIIDVTDPASPQKTTTMAGTKGAWDVHIYDQYLYVGCHGAGVAIFNISDKKSPHLIGSFRDEDGGEALGVWGDGRYLYVADNFGIEVLDVTDPTNPYEIADYGSVKGAHDLRVDGKFIYVAAATKGLMLLQFEEKQGY